MGNHGAEEDGVEPRERAVEARDQAPAHGKEGVAGVVYFASKTVPAVDQDGVARVRGYLARVLDRLPGHLGKSVALGEGAALGGAEAVLLSVAAVPDPVYKEVGDEEHREEDGVPVVLGRGVVGQVDGAVAVGERHARHVPEDEHESPLLVVHVPRGHDQLLTLGAGVGIKPVGHDEEGHLARYVPVLFVLSHRSADAEEQENVPGQADLEEHLEIEDAEHARVELGAHKEVVDGRTRHAVLRAAEKGGKVRNESDQVAREDRNRQQRAELIDNGGGSVDARDMKDGNGGQSNVERDEAGAIVLELLTAFVQEGLTIGVDTWGEKVQQHLEDEEDPVHGPRLERGECASVYKVSQVLGEFVPGLAGCARGEFAIVVRCANPHVPHEERKPNHHGRDTQAATEFISP